MKKVVLSGLVLVALSSFCVAGGDFETVEPVMVVPVEVEEELNGFYLGLGLSAISSRDAAVSMDIFNVTTGQGRLGNISFFTGYNFNEYIAVEGRYTTTFTNEDFVEMSGWSLFVKPQYPVSENFSVYGLLGFGGVTMDPASLLNVNVDDTTFQWGIGASYLATDHISVFIDYTSLANDMDGTYGNRVTQVDADAITIGVNYLF